MGTWVAVVAGLGTSDHSCSKQLGAMEEMQHLTLGNSGTSARCSSTPALNHCLYYYIINNNVYIIVFNMVMQRVAPLLSLPRWASPET